MESVKQYFRRFVATVMLLLTLSTAGIKPARAQFGVIDPAAIATDIMNSLREVAQLMQQLGVAEADLEWMNQIMDYAQTAMGLFQDVGLLQSMYQSLSYQAQSMKGYMELMKNMEADGFDISTLLAMKNTAMNSYDMIQRMIQQGMKILTDTGLSKAEKVDKAEQYAKSILTQSEQATDELKNEMDFLEASRGLLEFDNLISGSSASEGLDEIIPGKYEVESEIKTDMAGAFGEDMSSMTSSGGKAVGIVGTLLGILVGFSLIGVTVKYLRGDPGSETGFMRIMVVLVMGLVLLAAFSGAVGLNL